MSRSTAPPFLACANGKLIPESDLRIAYHDAGFVYGATVSERLRTFRGQLFRLEAHINRLQSSIAVVGTVASMTPRDLAKCCRELVVHNLALHRERAGPDSELGLGIFVTPGSASSIPTETPQVPLVGIYTYPLDARQWAAHYTHGARLVTVSVRQTAAENWPLHVKCRSRLHYYLAEREAESRQPGAFALLLSLDGAVSETPTANVLFVRGNRITSPPQHRILPGITLAETERLAREAALDWLYEDGYPLQRDGLTEVLLASTPFCLLPIVEWDGQVVGQGGPGPIFSRLIRSWSEMTGVDIVAQTRNG